MEIINNRYSLVIYETIGSYIPFQKYLFKLGRLRIVIIGKDLNHTEKRGQYFRALELLNSSFLTSAFKHAITLTLYKIFNIINSIRV